MKQEIATQRILTELTERGICKEENEDIICNYLLQAYAVGYDEGRKQNSHRKPVGQYSIEGKLIKVWDSITDAANTFNVDKSGIGKACQGKVVTIAGYRWQYINLKTPSFEIETIGTYQKRSRPIRPTLRTHFSKKD